MTAHRPALLVFRTRILRALAVVVFAPPIVAQTFYETPRHASDADRIRNEMLNDAASGRFRYTPPPDLRGAYEAWLEEQERERQAAWEDTLRYAERVSEEYREREDLERALAAAEEERRALEMSRLAAERERLAAEQRERDAERARQAAAERAMAARAELAAYVDDPSPRKQLEGAWRSQLGQFDPLHAAAGTPAIEFQRRVLAAALRQGEALGVIGLASLEAGDRPSFAELVVSVSPLPTADARAAALREHTERGHLGARLWLAAWLFGRDVGLRERPTEIAGAASPREYARGILRGAEGVKPLECLPWLVQDLAQELVATPSVTVAEELMSAIERVGTCTRSASPLVAWAQCEIGRAQLGVPSLESAGIDALNRSTGLATNADGSRNDPYPVAAALLGRVWLEGRIASFWPERAAAAFALVPEGPRWQYDRALGDLAQAYQLEFDPVQPYGSPAAIDRFRAATIGLARARGHADADEARVDGLGIPKDATSDERDARLWWLAGRVRFATDDEARAGARRELDALVADGDPWARVMRAYALVFRPTRHAPDATIAREDLRAATLFGIDLPAPRLLAALRAMACEGRFDYTLDATEMSARVLAMSPTNAFPIGVGELACAYFGGFQVHEIDERGLEPWLYESFVAAARGGGALTMQNRAATMAYVLQTKAITPEDWEGRWLGVFAEISGSPLTYTDPQRQAATRWQDYLREPTREKLAAIAENHVAWFGPRESQDGVESLVASGRIRFATTTEEAEEATTQLLELAGKRQWHAQRMVLDFEDQFLDAYMARADEVGFLRDVRRAAEQVAIWREWGLGFVTPDPKKRVVAITKALLLGSDRPWRLDLIELGRQIPETVGNALSVLDRARYGAFSLAQLEDPERVRSLEETEIVLAHRDPLHVPTRERLRYLLVAIGREIGGPNTLAWAEARRAQDPNVDWELTELHVQGHEWLPGGAKEGLIATCERAAARVDSRPTRQQLWRWMDAVQDRGDVASIERAADYLSKPDVRARFVAPQDALELGEQFADLAAALRSRVESTSDAALRARALARAIDMDVAALETGSTAAARSLTPDTVLAVADRARVVEALLTSSTWNAPLALPWIDAIRAQDPALAARLDAPWRAADGTPTWRLARIVEGRTAYVDGRDGGVILYDRHEPRDAFERRALLTLAWNEGSAEAREILRRAWKVPEPVIARSPETFAQALAAAARAPDVAATAAAWPEFEQQLVEVESRRDGTGDAQAVATLGESARLAALTLRTARDAARDAERARLDAAVRVAEESALDAGSLDAFLDLVARARSGGDAELIALARRMLARDRVHAALVEDVIATWVSDPTVLQPLLVEFGLHADGSTEHTHVCEYARWRTKRIERQVEGEDAPTKFPAVYPRRCPDPRGWLFQMLANDPTPDDPFVHFACRKLGVEIWDL